MATICSLLVFGMLIIFPWANAQDEGSGDFSDPGSIKERIVAVQEEIAKLPPDSSSTLKEQLQILEAITQYHLTTVGIAEKVKSDRDVAVKTTAAWGGFTEKPPYSVRLADDIRDSLVTLENAQLSGEAQLRIFTTDLESTRNKLNQHQQAGRRYMDSISSGSPEAKMAAEQSLRLEQTAIRIATEQIGRIKIRISAQRAELETIRAKLDLAKTQHAAIGGKTTFSREELDGILRRIASEREETLKLLRKSKDVTAEPNVLLSWKIEFLDLEKTFWETRFTSLNAKDSATKKKALATFLELQSLVKDWANVAKLRIEGDFSAPEEFDASQLRDSLQLVNRMERRIEIAIGEINGTVIHTPLLDRISVRLASLWNMELYLVEVSEILDGKKVLSYRAVTLGKLIRLALILAIGWLVLRALSRRFHKLILKREQIPESTADLVRRWSFGFGLALLLLYGMNTVHIPLTAFAFLGGALAIGIGFGTQTLLKNFISGIILIFERPLKVGDVVEVAGITGRIRSIGIRASVIQHFDGIDTLIPNSSLLENQVTNWTFSNPSIRHSIMIGVAYGSPTREVSRLLVAAANEHGQIHDSPEPEVRFEDFGDNSLVFRLLFWFDTSRTQRDPLASDLRFMIDKSFAEAGIVIAYPQLDIHFDPDKSMRVELSRRSASEKPNQPTAEKPKIPLP